MRVAFTPTRSPNGAPSAPGEADGSTQVAELVGVADEVDVLPPGRPAPPSSPGCRAAPRRTAAPPGDRWPGSSPSGSPPPPAGPAQEPGHLVGARDRPQRRLHLAAAVRGQHDVGGQQVEQRLQVAAGRRREEPMPRPRPPSGPGRRPGAARLDVLARPARQLAYGVRRPVRSPRRSRRTRSRTPPAARTPPAPAATASRARRASRTRPSRRARRRRRRRARWHRLGQPRPDVRLPAAASGCAAG